MYQLTRVHLLVHCSSETKSCEVSVVLTTARI